MLTLKVLLPPKRSKERCCRTRSSLACRLKGRSPISSRKRVPPCAASKRPQREPTSVISFTMMGAVSMPTMPWKNRNDASTGGRSSGAKASRPLTIVSA
jgi:hypothetical protein